MKPSGSAMGPSAIDYIPEIDGALAALGAVQPRDGLEQRVLARIASAPQLPWYRRLAIAPAGHHRWAMATASAVIVAGGIGMTAYRHQSAVPTPVAVHVPHPARQAAAAAAGLAVSQHPLQANPTKTRHRGIHRSYRATHERVPLPRGTAVPTRPHTIPANQ
jgi:hypothetical protein